MKPILKPILTSVVLFVGMSLVLPTSTASAQNFPMKPGESLNSVRETVRAWHTDHPKETATVTIAPGEYFLDAAVVFTAEDSNTRYVASDAAQKPVFTRGKEITGWKKDAEGRFVTQIADVRDGKLWFESLFVDGTRAIPARTPNADALEGRRYFYVLDADEMNPATKFIPREEQRALFEEIAASKNPQDVKISLSFVGIVASSGAKLRFGAELRDADGRTALDAQSVWDEFALSRRRGRICARRTRRISSETRRNVHLHSSRR